MSEELLKELEVKKQCASCVHWHNQDEMNLVSGSCRRFPPQVVSSQEFLWPRLSHDSVCGEFSKDAARVERMKESVLKHQDDEVRLEKIAQELYEKAQRGELGGQPDHASVAPAIDSNTGPVLPVLKSQQQPSAPLKPARPEIRPVLTVAQMKAFQGARK